MTYLWAFIVGGALCVIGQLLIDYTKLTPARILVGFVVAGVILGALGIYEPIKNFAGAGATVPLTGFGYALADGVKTQIDATGFSGIYTGALAACSGGITVAMVVSYLVALISKPKSQ